MALRGRTGALLAAPEGDPRRQAKGGGVSVTVIPNMKGRAGYLQEPFRLRDGYTLACTPAGSKAHIRAQHAALCGAWPTTRLVNDQAVETSLCRRCWAHYKRYKHEAVGA